MHNLKSSNDVFGWAHYYVAHLITACHMTEGRAKITLFESSKRAEFARKEVDEHHFYSGPYISDHECVMMSQRFLFEKAVVQGTLGMRWTNPDTGEVEFAGFDQEALDWWVECLDPYHRRVQYPRG